MLLFPLLLTAFFTSLVTAYLIAASTRWHGKFSLDYDTGIQKVHTSPTPRVGGIAIAVGALSAFAFLDAQTSTLWGLVLLACLPAFGAGLLEDITHKVSPKWRLLATAMGGLAFFALTGYGIDRLGWGPLDWISEWPVVMAILTMFAFAATANATNLIDGFNGLASASLIFMFLGLSGIAWQVNDQDLFTLCLLSSAMLFGFFLVNYPKGKLFLGDGGAYTLGSLAAALGIALIYRNDSVSPWALMVCFAYPAIETGFSIWRRRNRGRRRSISQPDGVHFHKLVWRAFARPIARHLGRPELANPLTLYFLWPLAATGPLVATLFYHRTLAAMAGILIVLVVYLSLYRVVSLQRRRKPTPPTSG